MSVNIPESAHGFYGEEFEHSKRSSWPHDVGIFTVTVMDPREMQKFSVVKKRGVFCCPCRTPSHCLLYESDLKYFSVLSYLVFASKLFQNGVSIHRHYRYCLVLVVCYSRSIPKCQTFYFKDSCWIFRFHHGKPAKIHNMCALGWLIIDPFFVLFGICYGSITSVFRVESRCAFFFGRCDLVRDHVEHSIQGWPSQTLLGG